MFIFQHQTCIYHRGSAMVLWCPILRLSDKRCPLNVELTVSLWCSSLTQYAMGCFCFFLCRLCLFKDLALYNNYNLWSTVSNNSESGHWTTMSGMDFGIIRSRYVPNSSFTNCINELIFNMENTGYIDKLSLRLKKEWK